MKKTWVIVAESARARIFSITGPRADLQELRGLTQPEARLKERDLVSDSHGRSFDSSGQGRHAMGREADHKHHEAETFAKHICGYVELARSRSAFEKLILIAPPEFLGLLRKNLSTGCADRVVADVNKNLVLRSAAEIRPHLPEWF